MTSGLPRATPALEPASHESPAAASQSSQADTLGSTATIAAAAPSQHPAQVLSPLPEQLPSDLASSHLDRGRARHPACSALELHRFNRTAAAASLGLSLRQIRYRMARLGVQISDQGVQLGERSDAEPLLAIEPST